MSLKSGVPDRTPVAGSNVRLSVAGSPSIEKLIESPSASSKFGLTSRRKNSFSTACWSGIGVTSAGASLAASTRMPSRKGALSAAPSLTVAGTSSRPLKSLSGVTVVPETV